MVALARPIFVVGCPRSGTTLVQCILSASPEAFSLPETHFFSGVLPALGLVPTTPLTRIHLAQVREQFEAEAELSVPERVWATLGQRPSLTPMDVFVEIVNHFRPASDGALRLIEKTPRHVLHLPAIYDAFPDARFVNVVRDPLDVASSLHGVPFEASRSVLSHAQRWTESVLAAQAFAATHPRALRTVAYERVVREPEAQVRGLCAFVDLPYTAAMLDEFGREAARNVGRGEAWKRDVQGGVILNRHGVWRGRLTPGQAWLVAQATRQLRAELGYLERPRASVASVAAAVASEVRVRFREARSSTGMVGAARHAGSVLKTLSAA